MKELRATRLTTCFAGVGMIARNLAHAALAAGFRVRFSTLAAALDQESMPAFERRIRRYTRPDALILDELGYLLCDTPQTSSTTSSVASTSSARGSSKRIDENYAG